MLPVSLEKLCSLLREHSTFVLTSHVNPDGDALGSELALALLLRSMGKSVSVINHSPTPDNFLWLDPHQDINVYDPAVHRDLILNADSIVVLDTNQPDRIRSMTDDVMASPARKLIIDHHLDPAPFVDYNFTDTDATSTGEIIFRIVMAMRPEALTSEIATPLYAAIMTDTGSFRFPRTIGETYRIAGRLVDAGADPTSIYAEIYERWTPGRMRLLGEVLDSMKTLYGGKVAYVVCTQEILKETGTTEADTDNFTVYPMSVHGVVIGILFLELKDGVKISFRSKGAIPINLLAKEFGGNGHLNAAGARLHDARLADVMRDVTEQALKYLDFASVASP